MKITDGGLKSKLVRQADLLGGEEAFVKAVRPRALLTLPFFLTMDIPVVIPP